MPRLLPLALVLAACAPDQPRLAAYAVWDGIDASDLALPRIRFVGERAAR